MEKKSLMRQLTLRDKILAIVIEKFSYFSLMFLSFPIIIVFRQVQGLELRITL